MGRGSWASRCPGLLAKIGRSLPELGVPRGDVPTGRASGPRWSRRWTINRLQLPPGAAPNPSLGVSVALRSISSLAFQCPVRLGAGSAVVQRRW
jgi:hypothetical protein